MKIAQQSIKLLWITSNPEQQIEAAARTCYKSEDKITNDSAYEFCNKLKNSGHHAMLEHAVASYRIITDRGISHEIVRHRIASYAQESTRYCNYSKNKFGTECTFIKPPTLTPEQLVLWKSACCEAEIHYRKLITSGASPQIARSVLPNCLKTEIVMMANLREWMHFITLRGSKAAHPQIQAIAYAIWEDLYSYAPSIFKSLTPNFQSLN